MEGEATIVKFPALSDVKLGVIYNINYKKHSEAKTVYIFRGHIKVCIFLDVFPFTIGTEMDECQKPCHTKKGRGQSKNSA